MKKIYLASASKARKKLLRDLGFKFSLLPVKVKEQRVKGRLSYAQLVKQNALRKALAAGLKIKSGLIIAADTISVQGGRIFGKPRNLREARAMLKRFSRKPQWVYSGLAVVDKDTGRTITAVEKTKVYMDKLSVREIKNYFAKVSPLDKAGSFDIQGRGSFFIRRIEGCFYNVVGLPLRRLYRIFKILGIKIFAFLLLSTYYLVLSTFLSGCSTEYNIATGQEEAYYYSTDKEVQIGRSIAQEVDKEYKPAEDPLIEKRVEDIGKKIAAVSDRKEIDYYFRVIEDDEVNAFSLPGGYVYVNRGLVDKAKSDDELAGVLGHEVGHIVARHSIKKLQAMQAYSILRVLVAATPGSGGAGTAADAAFTEILLGYGRDDELLADQLSVRYAKAAGYNPHAMIDFLERLQDIDRRRPLRAKSYYKTHPYVPDRLRIIKQELGEKIDFDDYINIEEKKGL
jgi:MAF protein